jgi:hypothetical protein
MAAYLKSTTYSRLFKLVLAADHITKAPGLAPAVQISKAGAAFGAAAGVVTEVGVGWYAIALTAADTSTAGDLAFYVTAATADDTDFADQVIDPTVARWGVNVVNWLGAAAPAMTGDAFARLGAPVGASISADIANKTGYALTPTERTAIADAQLDEASGIEPGWTMRQVLRIVMAALAGKVNGAATTAVNFRDQADTRNRIAATVDTFGNRTAVVLDPS